MPQTALTTQGGRGQGKTSGQPAPKSRNKKQAGGFLWINKDATSASLSNSRDDGMSLTAINSHVQKLSWSGKSGVRKPKKAPKPSSKSNTSSPSQSEPTTIQSPTQDEIWNLKLDQAGRPNSEVLAFVPPQTDLSTNAGWIGCDLCSEEIGPSLHKSNCSSDHRHFTLFPGDVNPWLLPRSNNADPFNCAAVQLDVWAHRILQYFHFTLLPGIISSDVQPFFLLNSHWDASIQNIIRGCLGNRMHMDALLAVTADRMKYVTGDELARTDAPELYAVKAIRSLRSYLSASDAIDRQVILDIFFLAWIEIHHTNYEGARGHLSIISQLVQTMGGLDQIDAMTRSLCIIADLHVASKTGMHPLFALTWDPGPLPESVRVVESTRKPASVRFGDAFFRLPYLGSQLRPVVTDLVSCVNFAEIVWRSPWTPQRDMEWVVTRANAIFHRLLSLPIPGPSTSVLELKAECCRLALVAWTMYTSIGLAGEKSLSGSAFRARAFVPSTSKRLLQMLRRINRIAGERCWNDDYGTLLWMLGMGFCSTRGDDHDWFASRFVGIAHQIGIQTYDALSKALGQYLPFDKRGVSSLRKLAMVIRDDSAEWAA